MIRHHPWIASFACAAIAIALLYRFHRAESRQDERAVTFAEDEVYEAVVRDMAAPANAQASMNQLVFDEAVLTDLTTKADTKACEETVRKEAGFLDNTPPPYNSLADKIYRSLTRGWDDGSLRADTIQNFIRKSCTAGPLSRTFHTDLPRVFVNPNSISFDIAPSDKNAPKDFRQTFPGANGIISLSHVGFDHTLREAMVSTSFICSGLCGSGQRYFLRKKRDSWVIIGKPILVWMS
jgi:hypothetical protein